MKRTSLWFPRASPTPQIVFCERMTRYLCNMHSIPGHLYKCRLSHTHIIYLIRRLLYLRFRLRWNECTLHTATNGSKTASMSWHLAFVFPFVCSHEWIHRFKCLIDAYGRLITRALNVKDFSLVAKEKLIALRLCDCDCWLSFYSFVEYLSFLHFFTFPFITWTNNGASNASHEKNISILCQTLCGYCFP